MAVLWRVFYPIAHCCRMSTSQVRNLGGGLVVLCTCHWMRMHACVYSVVACCNSTFVETHTVGCWWCNLVVCVGCSCDIAVTTWRSLCVRGSFAANYHLGTLGVQNIVDALPHARMQRLIIWRAFSSPSPVVVLCRPHATHPLLLGGVCWCGCTRMQLGACGGGWDVWSPR